MRRTPPRINVKKGTWQSIASGQKTALVRTDDKIFARFFAGNSVTIASGDRGCTCKIEAIRRYESLEHVLTSEDLSQIAHGNHEEALDYLSHIYDHAPPQNHRFIVLQLKLVKVRRKPC